MAKGTSINDAIHGLIHMTAFEKIIISTPGFNRLHDVYQNSTLYLTFPCNRTKRFEHSIGTMKLCSDMFYYSVLNAEPDELKRFYGCALKHIEGILDVLNSRETKFNCDFYFAGKYDFKMEDLSSLELDEQRRAFIPFGIPDEYKIIQVILMEAVRTAALLHDIGHPPFSHIIEHALKKAYEAVMLKKNTQSSDLTTREKDFLEALEPCFRGGDAKKERKLHEQMGDIIADTILSTMVRPFLKQDKVGNENGRVENLFSAIVYYAVMGMFQEAPFFSALHRIVDGDIDGDRLDYLTRDAKNSGVDVGKIDYNRIISDMRLYYIDSEDEEQKDNCYYFCFPIKAIGSVEDFLRRRYNLYKNIIYHHHVTKTDFLLESTVSSLIIDYLSCEEESSSSEAPELIPFDISGLWHPLKPKQTQGKEKTKDNLVQWNDAWLMTVLKQIYYRDYVTNISQEGQKPERIVIYRQLSELLLNEKYYISLTKRNNNFKILDDAIKCALHKRRADIDAMIVKGEQMSHNIREKDKEGEDGERGERKRIEKAGGGLSLRGTLDALQEIQEYCGDKKEATSFIAALLNRKFDAINKENGHFYDIVRKAVASAIEEVHSKNPMIEVADCIVAPVVFKVGVGTDAPIYFYDVGGDKKFAVLTDVSRIVEILGYELQHFPPFYLYIMLNEPERDTTEFEKEILISVGSKVAEGVFSAIQKIFEGWEGN